MVRGHPCYRKIVTKTKTKRQNRNQKEWKSRNALEQKSGKIGLESLRTVDSTAYFDDSLAGQLDLIFAQLPQDLLCEGLKDGWTGTMKKGQRLLIK